MKFINASCVVCGQSIFKNEKILAYVRRNGEIRAVDLEGEQPWSGVRCICPDCVKYINQYASWYPEFLQ
jgi:hypothetical protein